MTFLDQLPDNVIPWLLESDPPTVRYLTLRDLLETTGG